MYKLVIFDLDGTLLNTIEDITDSLNLALTDYSLPLVTIEECKYMVGQGVDVLVSKAVKDEKYQNGVKEKYLTYYALYQNNKTRPYPEIIEVIKKIKKMDIKIAVFSNKPHLDTIAVINYYFGNNLFDYVLGHKINNLPKPAYDGANEIITFFNNQKTITNEEVLFVGDTSIDMQTAKRANFSSVAVTWGFRKAHEIIPHDYLIHKPKELISIIRNKI